MKPLGVRFRFFISAAVLTVVASLLACAPVGAAYNPLASGQMKIVLAKPFLSLLAAHGVKIEATAGAKRRGAQILLPASAGEFDPTLGTGTVEGEGTLVLASGNRRLPFRRIVFKAKRSPLYTRVGGSQLKIASAGALHARREGFGERFSATRLRLTAKVASRLDKKLRLGKALSAGSPFGTLEVAVEPASVHLLPQGRLHLAVDPAFDAKLNELFVSLNPIAPAELGPGPTLSYPIGLESTLAPDAGQGLVKLGGASELLQLGSAQIFWREIWFEPAVSSLLAETDVEPSPPHSGKQPQAPLLALTAGGLVTANPSARTISISGETATLTEAAAAALNAAFTHGSPRFAAGEIVGSISLAAVAE